MRMAYRYAIRARRYMAELYSNATSRRRACTNIPCHSRADHRLYDAREDMFVAEQLQKTDGSPTRGRRVPKTGRTQPSRSA
jgi:hypothetical protein